MKSEVKGAILIVVASFFWGLAATAAKFIFNDNVNPFKLVNMRLNLAFLLLFLYLFIFNKQKLQIKKHDVKYLATLGIIGIVGVQSTYYYTVATLNVSIAIFLQYLAPALIVIYSVLFQKERLSVTIALSLGISLAGSIFIIFGGGAASAGSFNMIGLITGLVSALFLSFYTIYSKTCTARLDSWTVLVYALGFGALIYWFVSPPWVLWGGIQLKEFFYACYIAVFATIIPFGLYLSGLRYLSASTGSIIAMLEPVIASLSAFLLLGERMTIIQIMGGLLIIAAVIIINIYYIKKQEPHKEELS